MTGAAAEFGARGTGRGGGRGRRGRWRFGRGSTWRCEDGWGGGVGGGAGVGGESAAWRRRRGGRGGPREDDAGKVRGTRGGVRVPRGGVGRRRRRRFLRVAHPRGVEVRAAVPQGATVRVATARGSAQPARPSAGGDVLEGSSRAVAVLRRREGGRRGEGVHLRARARGCPRRSALPVRTRARVPQSPPRARHRVGLSPRRTRGGDVRLARARDAAQIPRRRQHREYRERRDADHATSRAPDPSHRRRDAPAALRAVAGAPRLGEFRRRSVLWGMAFRTLRGRWPISATVLSKSRVWAAEPRTAAADWPTRVLPESKIAPSSDRLAQGCCLRTIPFKRGAKSAGRVTHAPPKTRVPRRQIHLGRHSPHSNAARASKVRHRPTVARFPALSHRATFSVHSEGAGKGVRRIAPRGGRLPERIVSASLARGGESRVASKASLRVSRARPRLAPDSPTSRAPAQRTAPIISRLAESEQQRPRGRISSASCARRAASRRALTPPLPSLGEIAHV